MSSRAGKRTTFKQVSCEQCYFHCNRLCALQKEPCPTFRPDSPQGLKPPAQLRLQLQANDRRTQAAWMFPSAQEQAALHA